MLKLYADPITVNCRKAIAGLDLIGAPYERVHVDYFTGQHRLPEYVALNPNAALPALVDGDFVLWESNAILQYAADKHGNAAAYPTDPRVRADINRWLLWEASAWFPSCYVYLVENCVKPLLKAEPDPAVIEAQDASFHKLAGILDARSGKQPLDRWRAAHHRRHRAWPPHCICTPTKRFRSAHIPICVAG